MTFVEMLSELREILDDQAIPYGWADATLNRRLAEGQDVFCERTGFFLDAANYSLTLVSGTAIYDVPARVIQVIDVWDGNRRLTKDLSGRIGDEATSAAAPSHWNTDKTTGSIELFPTPTDDDADDEYVLRVWRYSQYYLDGDGAAEGVAAVPELSVRLQPACIEWAAMQAYRHGDLELRDEAKEKKHKAAFDDYVASGSAMFHRYHNVEARVGSDPAYRT